MSQEGHVTHDDQADSQPHDSPAAKVDIEALAEKVYRLLCEDLRLTRAYGARARR